MKELDIFMFTRKHAFLRLLVLTIAGMAQSLHAQNSGVDVQAPGVDVNVDRNRSADKPRSGFEHRASTLLDTEVRNARGDRLGTVSDIVIDSGDGKIRYLALSYGGLFGLGDKLFAVPVDAFELMYDANAKTPFIEFDVSEEVLRNAPGFDQNHWPALADAKWSGEIDQYYSSIREARRARRRNRLNVDVQAGDNRIEVGGGKVEVDIGGNKVGNETASLKKEHLGLRVKALMGMNVRNASNESIASVNDCMIDMDRFAVTYLALDTSVNTRTVAVPYDNLVLRRGDGDNEYYLVSDLTEQQLNEAFRLEGDQWPNSDMITKRPNGSELTSPR